MQKDPAPNQRMFAPSEGNTVTYFLIDGLSNEIFRKLLQESQLPNIAALIHESIYVKNGMVSFPSMTGYGFYPYLTGVDASKSGILGLRWLDRCRDIGQLRNYVGRSNVHMNVDIKSDKKTLFELTEPYYSSSINSYMNKGAHDKQMTALGHVSSKFQKANVFKLLRKIPIFGPSLAKNHFEHASQVMDIAMGQLDQNPKVQWVTFAGPDAYNHIYGTDSVYSQIIVNIDRLLGQYLSKVKSLGQHNQRAIVIVSDHGISDVDINIDPAAYLAAETGLTISRGKCSQIFSSALDDSPDLWDDLDAHFVINGDLCGYFYFRNRDIDSPTEEWSYAHGAEELSHYQLPFSEKYVDLKARLLEMDGIEILISKTNADQVLLESPAGASLISAGQHDTLSYILLNGSDPLDYATLLSEYQSIALDSREWLKSTSSLEYPFAVPRIWNLMQSEQAPDLVITSKKGYDFGLDFETLVGNFKGGHGGLRKELLSVPFIVHLPGQEPKHLEYALSEDVGATLFDWLGFSTLVLDGHSLLLNDRLP